jgi:hypothetical protein
MFLMVSADAHAQVLLLNIVDACRKTRRSTVKQLAVPVSCCASSLPQGWCSTSHT